MTRGAEIANDELRRSFLMVPLYHGTNCADPLKSCNPAVPRSLT